MITLFSSPTPNGYRASIMLEETGLAYRASPIDLKNGDHKSPAFLRVNPTGRTPAIVDDETAEPEPFALAETLAIALYLAEKSGRLLPDKPTSRALAYQWAATVISGFGAATPGIFFARQLGEQSHSKIIAKFFADIRNYLGAMDLHLENNAYLSGADFSFADAMAIPTIAVSLKTFEVDLAPFASVVRWRDTVLDRPAVKRGLKVPA